jgi:putative DNA primase/helicase
VGKVQNEIDLATTRFEELLNDQGKKLMYQGGTVYVYYNGAWDILNAEDERELSPLLKQACDDTGCDYATRTKALWANVYATSAPEEPVKFDRKPIVACPNGSLELANRDFEEWSPQHYTTRRLAIEYHEDATCPEWEAMLRRSLESPQRTPKEVEAMAKFLQQWVGINLVGPAAKGKSRHLRTGLIIDGPSGSGKTSFADVVRELFGRDRCKSPSLDDLGTQFGKAALLNCQALITDDGIGVNSKGDAKVLKAIVTGENMMVDRKFQSPLDFSFNGAVLFTTNVLPSIADETDAIYNRLRVVRMDKVFTKEEAKRDLGRAGSAIPFLQEKGEFPGILNWALDGFEKAWDQGHFDLPAEMQDAAKMFRMRNDPIFGFLHEALDADKSMFVPAAVMTALFSEYALENYQTKVPAKRAVNSLVRNIRDVIPSVQFENPNGGGQVLNYLGVKLSDVGMSYWTKVQSKQLPSLERVKKPHSRRA